MNHAETDSQPLRERMLPQASIRFFLLLIGFSAAVMYTLRAAFIANALWAKVVSLMLMTSMACFVLYVLMFLLANLFATTTAPLVRHPIQESATSTKTSESPVQSGEA